MREREREINTEGLKLGRKGLCTDDVMQNLKINGLLMINLISLNTSEMISQILSDRMMHDVYPKIIWYKL